MIRFSLTLFLALWLTGCGSCGDKKAEVPESPEGTEATAEGDESKAPGALGLGTAPQAEAVPEMDDYNSIVTAVEREEDVAPRAPDGDKVAWSGPIQWVRYEEALTLAKESGKHIFLIFYADWCPKCRALGPIFGEDQELHALSEKLIMVRTNQMLNKRWMEAYKKKGGYVPRIYFLNAKGELREDLKSPHPRFPFFYATNQIKQLKANMRKASGG
jgi:thiol-disulfide isomerase/thioredoxin